MHSKCSNSNAFLKEDIMDSRHRHTYFWKALIPATVNTYQACQSMTLKDHGCTNRAFMSLEATPSDSSRFAVLKHKKTGTILCLQVIQRGCSPVVVGAAARRS